MGTEPITQGEEHPRVTAPTHTPLRPKRNPSSTPSSSAVKETDRAAEGTPDISALTAPVIDEEQPRRIRLDIAYDGTDFHGWARQKGLRTVQGELEDALSTILREPISLTVAGRTDAGVHASGQVAHFDVHPRALDTRSIHGEPRTLVRRLARLLPVDVRVMDCQFAPAQFDARFSALRRHYVYRVTTAAHGALPTRARDTAVWRRSVDVSRLQQAADQVIGLHDFAAFCKARPFSTTIREVESFRWKDVSTGTEPQTYEAHISADAFCWSMVRSLVGGCLAVAEGRRTVEFMSALLHESKRSSKIPLAPADGLTLVRVDYPEPDQYGERALQTRDKRSTEDLNE